MTLPRVGVAAPFLSAAEARQRRWELERAQDAARTLIERLEMAGRTSDVRAVQVVARSLSADLHASRSPDSLDEASS